MASPFSFLHATYPELFTIGELSEKLIHIDPSSSIAKSRLFAEKLSQLIWNFENLEQFDGNQVERINQLAYRNCVPSSIKDLLHAVRKSGNLATHSGSGSYDEALSILNMSYQLAVWFFETYENVYLDKETYRLPADNQKVTVADLNTALDELSKRVFDYEQKIAALNATPQKVKERQERSNVNASNLAKTEAETRALIDDKLRRAGWECDTALLNYKSNKTIPQKGRNLAIAEWPCGSKWADYALFIGTTLYGIVEAKKYATDISTDLRQSKVYASCIESKDGLAFLGDWNGYKVPFLFSTNGREYLEQIKTKSGIWFLDIRNDRNHAMPLQGWFSPQGLLDLWQRNIAVANQRLQQSDYDYLQNPGGLNLRDYQIDAIKAVEDKIVNNPDDKRALLVMATGTGKTRTVIGLAYRFIKSDRFKRILFLTDRRLLATQALGNFKDNKVEDLNTFENVYHVDGLKTAVPEDVTRLQFATVQSMVKRLFYSETPLPIDTYDCIIIDEAHRGYNPDKEIDEDDLHFKDQDDYVGQYKRVIEYFNAYIIGLTATPALHTTEIFGNPTHTYSYREAVIDGHLTDHEPPYLLKTKLSEGGILWEKGEKPKVFNPETNNIEELAELQDELLVEIEQFNKLVITEPFNKAIIQQLVKELDPESDEKTLIFAVRDTHADLIVKLLYEEFEAIGVDVPEGAIEKITGNIYDPESLTKRFKNEKYPNIAVTVELLTTGIDVPQICNLVFMRRVRSRILFEQMLGRATRLCSQIDKQFFKIYDAVRVYEALEDYTQMKTVSNPSISFEKLVEELNYIEEPERSRKQMEMIIAKLQRKRKLLQGLKKEEFEYLSKEHTVEEFIALIRNTDNDDLHALAADFKGLWKFLDEKIYQPKMQLLSEHDDKIIGVERGYGKATQPEDYIENFKQFIAENRNKILAIQLICTKPSALDRKSLKELKMLLDQEGFNDRTLNTAWKNAKNVDIAADIISFIRTLALNTNLVSHQQRISNAVAKIKASQSWNAIQLKWLNRFEAQLLAETILTKEDLDKEPFKEEGGFTRLNKIFDNKLDHILAALNDNLYSA